MDLSTLSVPAPGASSVDLRLSPLPRSGDFRPDLWQHAALTGPRDGGWWDVNLRNLALPDGSYEYEFILHRAGRSRSIADPYAEELTRLSGYRAVLHMRNGERIRPPFSWDGELPAGRGLPNNNEIVIYELPIRWIDPGDGYARQVSLGTLDKATFEHLDRIQSLHVNCIELLPVQDSPDTLNWGYGTRFFFAPDLDMGSPFDLRLFVKRCHQRGIRVVMDIVMNHARGCPLAGLAYDWFFLKDGNEEPDPNGDARPSWGGDIFRYRTEYAGAFHARNFHYDVARFFISEYHIDGFRIDEFKGINNYDFIQTFTNRAHAEQQRIFGSARPFLVIGEDSWRRAKVTTSEGHNHARVVDAIWDFNFRDEVRRLVADNIWTKFGETSRTDRVRRMLTVARPDLFGPDEKDNRLFWDLANRVTYCTSHDVQADEEQRLLPYYFDHLGGESRFGKNEPGWFQLAGEMLYSTFALTLTSAGMPMFLAGEEFGDLHDSDRRNWMLKMSDPVDFERSEFPGHAALLARVSELVELRATHSALHRNELEFFGFSSGTARQGFHPTFDENRGEGERLFAFCRTGGRAPGSDGQVIVIANCSSRDYPAVDVDWPWGFRNSLKEHGGTGQPMPFVTGSSARFALKPHQVRVFSV
jgi:1,4-alpha-glucan branching enzyme